MNTFDHELTPADIRRIRLQLDLTQEEAGKRIGGGPRAFSKYEKGEVQPSAAIENLLRILDADPGQIATIGGSPPDKQQPTALTPFVVTGQHVRSIRREEFPDVFRRLLYAEASANDLPLDGIHVASNIDAPDGGEDARIFWEGGPERTLFLPSRRCQFQLKTGRITPRDAGRELAHDGVVKPMVRSVVEDGGNYIMISTHPYVRQEIQRREKEIRETLRRSECGIRGDQIDFRDADQFAMWVNSHPSVATWLLEHVDPGSVGPFHSLEHSRTRPEHSASVFVDDPRLPALRARIRESVVRTASVLRLVGLSGIGKSRLVLESLAHSSEVDDPATQLDHLVMYAVASGSGFQRISDTVEKLVDSGLRAVAVVDDCELEQHQILAGLVKRSTSRVSLVTIDDEVPRTISGATTSKIDEAPHELGNGIVDQILPEIASEDRRRLVQFAKGFPEIAKRIAEAWSINVPIAHFTDDHLVDRYIFGHSPIDEALLLKSSRMLAAFGLLGWEQPVDELLNQVTDADLGASKDELRAGITNLLQRGIVQKRGRFVTLRPRPIAMNLAERQWEEWAPAQWDRVLAGDLNPELKRFAARQLAAINTTDVAKRVAKHICRQDGPFSSIQNLIKPGHPQIISSLAEIDQLRVAELVEIMISDIDDLRQVQGDLRRNLVYASEKIAFDPRSFDSGAGLLLELATHENESWVNNATGLFEGLFTLYLGGTAADGEARISYLDNVINAHNAEQSVVLVKALSAGASLGPFDRTVGAESHGSLEAYESWKPSTNEDIREYITAFVDRLATFASDDTEAGALAKKELGGHVCSLVKGGFVDLVETIVAKMVKQGMYWPDGLRGVYATLTFEIDLDEKTIKRVQKLAEVLQPSDVASRVSRLVTDRITFEGKWTGTLDHEGTYTRDVDAVSTLAEELLADAQALDACLPALVKGRQIMAYEFGKSLGGIVDDPMELYESIEQATFETSEEERDLDLLVGYVRGLQENHPATVQSLKQRFLDVHHLVPAFSTLCLRLGHITTSDVELAVDALRKGVMRPSQLGPWTAGGLLSNVAAVDVTPLFEVLIDHSSEGLAQAADLMGMYVYRSPEKLAEISDQIVVLAENASGWKTNYGQSMADYHFQQLMESMLSRGRGDRGARSTALALAKNLAAFDEYGEKRLLEPVLPTLLSGFPEIAWPIIGQAIVSDERKAFLLRFELSDLTFVGENPDPAILNLPEDVLFAWCYSNPDRAPTFAAEVLPVLTTLDVNANDRDIHPSILRLIDEFGDRQDVLEAIGSNIDTFGWSGSATEYFRLFDEPLRKLFGHEKRDVRIWARKMIAALEEAHDRARDHDEEREVRSEF